MGQRFFSDRIGALSHNAGVITLGDSRVTIGGQQYKTGALQLTLSGLAAHSTYMLYVVLSAGVLTLVSSTNVNSVGPAGFTSWKLVGAFLASETPAFGAFVNIEGKPSTQGNMAWTPSNASGFGTISSPNMNFARDGRWLVCDFRFTTGTVAASTAFLTLPTNLLIDNLIWAQTSYHLGSVVNNSAVNFTQMFAAPLSNQDRVFFSVPANLGGTLNGNASPFASGQVQSGQFRIPISGWSATPLKDL
jgi:hypothetical protein